MVTAVSKHRLAVPLCGSKPDTAQSQRVDPRCEGSPTGAHHCDVWIDDGGIQHQACRYCPMTRAHKFSDIV